MKKIFILSISIMMLIGLCGCNSASVKSSLEKHNIDDVIDKCKEYKNSNNSEGMIKIKKEVINGYIDILNGLYTKEVDINIIDTYTEDLNHFKNNFEWLIVKDNLFLSDLEKLYNEYYALSYYRGKLNLIKEYYDDYKLDKMNEILKYIPFYDTYAMNYIVDFSKNSIEKQNNKPIELVSYEVISKYQEGEVSDLKYVIKNNTNEHLSNVTVLLMFYTKNGDVVKLDYPISSDFPYIMRDEIFYFDSNTRKFEPNSLETTMTPCSGEMDMQVSMIVSSYSVGFTEYQNEYFFLQLYNEIIRNNITIPKVVNYYDNE